MDRIAKRIRNMLLAGLLATAGISLGFNSVSESADVSKADSLSSQISDTPVRSINAIAEPCRGPEFAGCTTCCRPEEGHRCTVLSWSGPDEPGLFPFYNSFSFEQGDCPVDCRPCASCLSEDERNYAALGTHPDCDCDTVVIGIDPCFAPRSCECYCQQKLRILAACPQLGP